MEWKEKIWAITDVQEVARL